MKAYLKAIDTRSAGPRYDVTPLFGDQKAFRLLVKDLAAPFRKVSIDGVACIDALGFILGTAVAVELEKRIVALRKAGKLPVPADRSSFRDYSGKRKALELRKHAVQPGERILLVDEWIETGAQINSAIRLIQKQKGEIAGIVAINMDRNQSTDLIRNRYRVHTVWTE
jgi:adenine phosphoribosyltransferase